MCSPMQVRPPMPPRFFFVIDVSYVAVNSGALPVICQAIKDSLDRLPGGERTQVGFLTFDSTLHFYNLASRLSQPQMMVGALSALPSVDGACLLLHRPPLIHIAQACSHGPVQCNAIQCCEAAGWRMSTPRDVAACLSVVPMQAAVSPALYPVPTSASAFRSKVML